MSYMTDYRYDMCRCFDSVVMLSLFPNEKNLDILKNSVVARRNVFELKEVSSVHLLWPIIMALDPNLVCMDLNISQVISKVNMFHVLKHGYFEVKFMYSINCKAICVMIS